MEKEGGVTILLLMKDKIQGILLKQASYRIGLGDPLQVTMDKAIRLRAQLMVETLHDISCGNVVRIPQKHLQCSFRARNIKPGEQLVDWEQWEIERIWHLLRGAYHWISSKKLFWIISYRLGNC